MNPSPNPNHCERAELACAYALEALPASEVAAAETHIASCEDCRRELDSLRPVVNQFVSWPIDVLRPTASLQLRLALRIAEETGERPAPPPPRRWSEPEWEQVAPGIECKLLATDNERRRVSMLVRLAPGASYPAHTHAGVEELHLLDGELWIDERKLFPGDYNYGAPGAGDERVWSETGCTCVLGARAELRDSERHFRHLTDSEPVIIRMTDPAASCTFLSGPWYEFTAQSPETGLGLGWVEAIHPDDRESARKAIISANERQEAFRLDYRLRRKDGEYRWAIDSAVPRFGPQGEFLGHIGSVIDITERKLAEEALKEADRRKDEFLAMVSHELRTPLNSILGWNRMLREKRGADPYIAQVTEVVERSGRAQLRLIEDLLDTARIVSGKMRLEVGTVELSELIASAIETVRPAAECKGVLIIPMLGPATGRITGDPDRLQQVVWNLLSNAVKYTPANGQIHIELRRGPSDARIVVRDTGEGIAPDLLPYVFDRFKQGDSSAPRRLGGLGLGLTIVKHLVELHGGRVSVESQGKGMGATFTVSLPAPAPPAEGNGAASPRASTADRLLEGLQVLVVDDEEDARELVAVTLTLRGAMVTQVESAAAALAALESQGDGGPFDLIVSDIGMPGEDGYSLLRKIRSMSDESVSRIQAVALTSHARSEDRMRALQAGYQTRVVKPVEIKELITVVAGLMGRRL